MKLRTAMNFLLREKNTSYENIPYNILKNYSDWYVAVLRIRYEKLAVHENHSRIETQ